MYIYIHIHFEYYPLQNVYIYIYIKIIDKQSHYVNAYCQRHAYISKIKCIKSSLFIFQKLIKLTQNKNIYSKFPSLSP